MNFINSINTMINHTKERQRKLDEKIDEIKKTQFELDSSLSARQEQAAELSLLNQ